MKIAIIGCGYVGSRAAGSWKKSGHFVTVTTRRPERVEKLQECSSEVFLLGNLKELIAGKDLILLSVAPGKGEDYRSTYLETAQDLMACVEPHQHVLYTGSTSVYGDKGGGWVNEETPVDPLTPHAEVLAATEKILLKHPNACLFRLGEILGPGRTIVERLKKMPRSPLPGTGDNMTNWIHVDDIVEAFELARNRNLTGIYNLCNGEHVTRREAYLKFCSKAGLPPPQWSGRPSSYFRGNKKVSNEKIKAAGLTKFTPIL